MAEKKPQPKKEEGPWQFGLNGPEIQAIPSAQASNQPQATRPPISSPPPKKK